MGDGLGHPPAYVRQGRVIDVTVEAAALPHLLATASQAAVVAAGELVMAAVDCFGGLSRWGMSYLGSSPTILYRISEPKRTTVF